MGRAGTGTYLQRHSIILPRPIHSPALLLRIRNLDLQRPVRLGHHGLGLLAIAGSEDRAGVTRELCQRTNKGGWVGSERHNQMENTRKDGG